MRYPLCNCLNPKRIVNPVTHDTLIVPCGHCLACAVNRSSCLQMWCDLEAQSCEYCLFITLTYANRFIPRAQILDSVERPFGHDLVTSDGEILGSCDLPQSEIDSIIKKTYLFGSVPYLRKADLQKFFKRFRYYVGKGTKAKMRYFACGEYGPVHYRPHYHILLFFDDPAVLSLSREAVCQAWPFGRVDVQLSKGSASEYVAGYVNSTCALPALYKCNAIRPFCVHSTRLGYKILQKECAEVYATPVDDFIKRSLLINGKYREFSLWRAFYAYYFPKCRGFINKSTSQRVESYWIFNTARKAFPDRKSVLELAKDIASCAYFFGKDDSTFWDEATRQVVKYFWDDNALNMPQDSDAYSHYIQRIYTELLLSKHFLYVCCTSRTGWPTYEEVKRKISIIDSFYKRLDYLHLRDFFQTQSLFFENHLYGDDDLLSDDFGNSYYPYFYDNLKFNLDAYKVSPAYRLMSKEISELYYQRIKHKELYDKNGIFLDAG